MNCEAFSMVILLYSSSWMHACTAMYKTQASKHKMLLYDKRVLRCTADLRRQLIRHEAPYRDPTYFLQKTVYAMRMLAGVEDQRTRISLSHDLYRVSVLTCTCIHVHSQL